MEIISLDSEIKYREITGDSIIIPPHSFLLATTREYIEVPADLTAFVEGRSSIGRIGLYPKRRMDRPGFKGRITLELYNASSLPIKLQAGKRICQLVFCKMDKAAAKHSGKYQGQKLQQAVEFLKIKINQTFIMKQYLELVAEVLRDGVVRKDRTAQARFPCLAHKKYDLRNGFPWLQPKSQLRSHIENLLWFKRLNKYK